MSKLVGFDEHALWLNGVYRKICNDAVGAASAEELANFFMFMHFHESKKQCMAFLQIHKETGKAYEEIVSDAMRLNKEYADLLSKVLGIDKLQEDMEYADDVLKKLGLEP